MARPLLVPGFDWPHTENPDALTRTSPSALPLVRRIIVEAEENRKSGAKGIGRRSLILHIMIRP
jgi:hypothetical protein